MMITVEDIYLTCQNIAVDATFNLYENQFTYSRRIRPSYTVTYKEMDDYIRLREVIKFHVGESLDVVDCLIL